MLTLNIAQRLRDTARRLPQQRAVVAPAGRDRAGRVAYAQLTFRQLDDESDRLAGGLVRMGVTPGTRLVLMVRPGLEFIALTFALFKAGAVVVLIDPGMGRSNIFRCLEHVEPEGFVAVPIVHAIRVANRRRFRQCRFNVTVGRRWFWGGATYGELLAGSRVPDAGSVRDTRFEIVATRATDPAAIIFTSGSTGPPKGVVYEHGMFDAQVDMLREFYRIQPGEIDLSGFPLFALFNAAMGVTTVIPDMDPTRPAAVDPLKILQAIENQGVTQAFGSPAIWNRVGRHVGCVESARPHQHESGASVRSAVGSVGARATHQGSGGPVGCVKSARTHQAGSGASAQSLDAPYLALGSLKRVLSAGAPVPLHVLERMTRALPPDGDIHTPYGATESLPVASIGGREILSTTAARSRAGAGTCVGRLFPRVEVKIIEITDGPIASLSDVRELPAGEIGEIIVRSPSTTREYFRDPEATRAAKISGSDAGDAAPRASADPADPADAAPSAPPAPTFWHRMGDVGYLDDEGRLWFCGRKAHIVETARGRMFTISCEAIVNEHPRVFRSALVGVGKTPENPRQQPLFVVEPEPGCFPRSAAAREQFVRELRALTSANPLTAHVETFLFHRSLPVDIRHNVKIFREKLAVWAAKQLGR